MFLYANSGEWKCENQRAKEYEVLELQVAPSVVEILFLYSESVMTILNRTPAQPPRSQAHSRAAEHGRAREDAHYSGCPHSWLARSGMVCLQGKRPESAVYTCSKSIKPCDSRTRLDCA
eukprot:scaffold35278_cov33-Tisochrysis_lutea.AAC.2